MISSELRRLAQTQRFWTDYFWLTEPEWSDHEPPYPELDRCTLTFPMGPARSLQLELDSELSYFSLILEHPELLGTHEIAWDDQAHWHPHVLRWEELELLCRAIELQDPSLPHPGLPLLLLHRFAPICSNDDAALAFPLLESAWRRTVSLPDYIRTRLLRRGDVRHARLVWRRSQVGDDEQRHWTVHQPDDAAYEQSFELYSLRSEENDTFPFAQLEQLFFAAQRSLRQIAAPPDVLASTEVTRLIESLTTLDAMTPAAINLDRLPVLADALELGGYERHPVLEALREEPSGAEAASGVTSGAEAASPLDAARACWLLELLTGADVGAWVRERLGQVPAARPRHPTAVHMQLNAPGERFPPGAVNFYADRLAVALAAFDAGIVESSQSRSDLDGVDRSSINLELHGDATVGIELIRRVLLWGRAPSSSHIATGGQFHPLEGQYFGGTRHIWLLRCTLEPFRPSPGTPFDDDDDDADDDERRDADHDDSPIRQGVRYVPQPLGDRLDYVQQALAAHTDANAEPTPDGYQTLRFDDGGHLEVQLTGGSDVTGVSCRVRELSPDACALALHLSRTVGLLITPMMITASPNQARFLGREWPGAFLVEDPDELHRLLIAGPRSWRNSRGPAARR